MKFVRVSVKPLFFTRTVSIFCAILLAFLDLLTEDNLPATELPVPSLNDVTRVERGTPINPQDMTTATYILKTTPHATLGDAYVIVTDQTNAAYLDPLQRLAEFHHGSIIHVQDLSVLRSSDAERTQLIADLRNAKPNFVAIAPKFESFTENMLLGMWSVLTSLSDDRQLPVFPGILVAANPTSFGALIDRSIHFNPPAAPQIHPFIIGQVLGQNPLSQRSLQKVRMIRNLFASDGCTTSDLLVFSYNTIQEKVTVPPTSNEWQLTMTGPRQLIKTIPPDVVSAMKNASLWLLFGHGLPGMACDLELNAFRDIKMTDKIVMCGTCFSAFIGGNESFALQAIDNGANVVYANMRENVGFPFLFPVLESWMNGLSVGEAYQRQINALISFNAFSQQDILTCKLIQANPLLYVIIGDPALHPLPQCSPSRK